MKKADNPKNQMKVEAKEQSGMPVAQALEAKSTTVELGTPLTEYMLLRLMAENN